MKMFSLLQYKRGTRGEKRQEGSDCTVWVGGHVISVTLVRVKPRDRRAVKVLVT